jgi:hypothetical protein
MKAAEVMITNVITVVEKVLAQLQAEAWTSSLINVIVQDGTVESPPRSRCDRPARAGY